MSRRKKRKIIFFSIIVLILFFLLGLAIIYKVKGKDKAALEDTNVFEEIPKVKIVDENSLSRPYAVMINNSNPARPYQSGLQDAYLIYEIIAEGGITRYMALFKDQNTPRIASVRSARHYFLDYALENDAIFVHWGYSTQAYQDIKSLNIDNIDGISYENKYFKRDNTLNVATEHRGYTTMQLLQQATTNLKYRSTTNQKLLLNYSAKSLSLNDKPDALVASQVNIPFSSSTTTNYTYDEDLKVYLRSVNNEPNIDYITKKQYNFKNIITYKIKNSQITGDDKGRQNLNNIGTGKGYYITEGYAIPITWIKTTRVSQTKYYLTTGEELTVNDGNTFIEIQPANQELEIY